MFTEFIQAGILPFSLMLFGIWISRIIYNLYFHPLSKIPGPWLAAICDVPYCWWLLGGRQPFKLLELHNKYGPYIRTAPNEVSFNTAQSWDDIYTHKSGRQVFLKGPFYDGATFASDEFNRGVTTIASERRPEVHKHMRSYLSSAFSERAIVEQEELIAASVNKFVQLVGIRGSRKEGANLTRLFEAMTFDVASDLAFGEALGALDAETRHPWISASIGSLMMAPLVDVLNHYPTLARALVVLLHDRFKKTLSSVKANEKFVYDAVKKRIEMKTDRKDFLTRIIEDRDPNTVSDRQIAAHSSDIVLAGSDTTATALCATVYFLLRNPASLEKLTTEIRNKFQQYPEITYSSTVSLRYLRAVIQESLRMFPPVSLALPRVVPSGGAMVDNQFIPGGAIVSTNPMAATLSSTNFHDPWKFKPERWIDPDNNDVLESSQPFSLGPRVCIGRNVAWVEMHTAIAKLLWAYDLELADPTLDWYKEIRMVSLWETPKLMVKARNRGVKVE